MIKAVKIFHYLVVAISIVYTTYILAEFVGHAIPYYFAAVIGLIIGVGTHLVSMIAIRKIMQHNDFHFTAAVAAFMIIIVALADYHGSHTKSLISFNDNIKAESSAKIEKLNTEIAGIANDKNHKVRKWANDRYIFQISDAGQKIMLSKQAQIDSINAKLSEDIENAENSQSAVIWALRFIALTLYSFVLFSDYYLLSEQDFNESHSTRKSRIEVSENGVLSHSSNEDLNRGIGFVQNQEKSKLEKLFEAYESGERNFAKLSAISGLNGRQIKALLEKESKALS